MSNSQDEAAALGLLGSRVEQLAATRAEACEAAHRLAYVKLPNDEPRDVDEIKKPRDVAAAERYARRRIDTILANPASTQEEMGMAMRLWKKTEAAIQAARDGEAELAGATKHIATRLEAERIRSAQAARAASEREAAEARETDRVSLSADAFTVKYGSR